MDVQPLLPPLLKDLKGMCVSEPERCLNIYTENVEIRRLCNFPHETGFFHLKKKKDHTDIQCFLKNNKIEREGQVTEPLRQSLN